MCRAAIADGTDGDWALEGVQCGHPRFVTSWLVCPRGKRIKVIGGYSASAMHDNDEDDFVSRLMDRVPERAPCILLGDFNAHIRLRKGKPSSAKAQKLETETTAAGFTNVMRTQRVKQHMGVHTWSGTFGDGPLKSFVDHIFVKLQEPLRATRPRIVTPHVVTDHRLLKIRLRMLTPMTVHGGGRTKHRFLAGTAANCTFPPSHVPHEGDHMWRRICAASKGDARSAAKNRARPWITQDTWTRSTKSSASGGN